MKSENYIEEKVGRNLPFKVPDNYFEDLSGRIEKNLPPYPEAPRAQRLSTWHRYRPYVYMAAMFAGIWCMMKMFHTMTSMSESLDAPAEHIAMVMENPAAYGISDKYGSQEDFALESEVAELYSSPDELAADLGLD